MNTEVILNYKTASIKQKTVKTAAIPKLEK